MLKLDNRLSAIFDEIPSVNIVADIGCDHGKLIVKTIIENKSKKGIAVDISLESLKKAENLAKEYDVLDKIEFLYGDGFLPLKEKKIDLAVISGMGAREIVKILKQKDIAEKYILVPHQDAHILRQYLKENNFFVIKDYICKEQKFYPIIVVKKGNNNYLCTEIYLGKNSPKNSEYDEWIAIRYNTVKNIIARAGLDSVQDDIKNEWEELTKWQNS